MKTSKKSQKSYLKRLFGHLKVVHNHRRLVRIHCFKCGLIWQGLTHDLSKYSYSEFHPSVKYFQGDRSPYAYEKELYGFSYGWLHHKGKNKHHFEYWVDVKDGAFIPLEMPYKYVVESVCDRIAACKIYQQDAYTQASPLNYFLEHSGQYAMHPNTRKQFKRLLTLVLEEGEEAAFLKIKDSLKRGFTL